MDESESDSFSALCNLNAAPPADFGERTVTGDEWTIDWEGLEKAITPKTKMIVINIVSKFPV